MKKLVIMDCDPGHDDAIAILVASKSPSIELLGISVASGNQTIEKTAKNALSICDYLGIDVPVCAGEPKPLVKPALICPEIHGETGLDGFDFPKETRTLDPRPGYQLIIDTCLSNDKVILVPTGPLTNVALALSKNPEIKKHIEKIVLMGGSMGTGNMSPFAEFNILVDPEAAKIVFESGLPIYMCGLDVTRKVLASAAVIERMKKIGGIGSKMFVDLMVVFNKNQEDFFGWEKGAPLHDPVTIVSLIDEKAVHFEPMDVEIDVSGGERYGQTRCKPNPNSHVYCATEIDVEAYWDVIESAIRRYK